jgi:hypothetical protein
MVSHSVIHVYKITIELPRTVDVVNVLWSIAGVHINYYYYYYYYYCYLSVAYSHVKCGVVGDEIYVYFHILCVVI